MTDVKVTDKEIPIPNGLYEKILLMCKRLTQTKPKWDCVLNIDGVEGIGKTTLSILIGYVVAYETNRPFSEKNLFFNVNEGMEFAKSTENQVIIFDEPSNDALGIEFRNRIQINLIKLLMQCRKKRHFIIFNLTKFYKFAEYIVVDRPIGMFHVYGTPESSDVRWAYIPQRNLEVLFNDYKFKKQRNYFRYKTIIDDFPDILDPDLKYNILDVFDVEDYEKRKDKGIEEIGKEKTIAADNRFRKKLKQLQFNIANYTTLTQKELAEIAKVSSRVIQTWKTHKIDSEEEE